ncbi:MAG: SocA family protein [Pseudomonadota bacterium]|nr:SocA family protein [Pseudomonadota bacterium]
MLISREREKLINVIIYFASNTQFPGKTKLCKLLYFLDFEHYKETGRSVTGMNYYAWKMGPVPVSLYEEMDKPSLDLAAKVEFSEKKIPNGATMLFIKPIRKFDNSYFSKREMRIMKNLVREYRNKKAEDMIEATHLENEPWHKIYVEQGKLQQLIPYSLALRRQEKEEMNEIISERQALIEHFKQI